MKTTVLIDRLAGKLTPVPRGAAWRILALGTGGGFLVSCLLMLAWLGIRPDLVQAMGTAAYWIKFGFTLALTLFGLWTVERLARPGAAAKRQMLLLTAPLTILAVLGLVQWMETPAAQHIHLLMGASHAVCPWRIVALALPVFAGALWSMTRLAPTRPQLAGAAAGLLAGAAGAWVYAYHCDESSAVFVAVWYTLGIALVGLLGVVVGRWALRW